MYGWYSNRTRGYRKQQSRLGATGTAAMSSDTDEPAPLAVRQAWARLIRKVYEVDPLLCPRCGGTMRMIAVIEQPAVIRQILDHLGIAQHHADRSPPITRPADSCGNASFVRESPAWSYDPRAADPPLGDPLTV